jgi:carbamate kinase
MRRSELARHELHPVPLDSCDADTQGAIGYMIQQSLENEFLRRGLKKSAVALVTQVEVDPRDAAFARPTKPVGPLLDPPGAAALAARGAAVADDAGRGPRRVVPSPDPVRVVEGEVVRRMLAAGAIVVAGGGGGVPVVGADGGLRGVEAVVDKDLTAALLADAVDAGLLVLLTDVPCAYTDYRTPRQAPVGRVEAARARRLLAEGHFAPGSMGPKIEACARFASAPGRAAVVCDPPGLAAALRGEAGTTVVPDR